MKIWSTSQYPDLSIMKQFRNPHFYMLALADCCIFALSLISAYFLRLSFSLSLSDWARILYILPWIILVKFITFNVFDVYRGMWRYFSFPDAVRLLKAAMLASLIIITALLLMTQFKGYPRSVFLADAIFTFFFCGILRASIRLLYQQGPPGFGSHTNAAARKPTRVLIIGAGDAAENIIREVQGNTSARYTVAACLDDDPAKRHRSLHGIPVDGPVDELENLVEKYRAKEVLIAIPSASGERMREIVGVCEQWGGAFKTLPSMTALISGQVSVRDLREVQYEDLLGRPPVKLDENRIIHYLQGKDVAITGAGGSIGAELCRQVLRFKPGSITLIESSELNLYHIENELRQMAPSIAIHAVLGRVQDGALIEQVFQRRRPQVVFHAAACKHVPMVELNPWEAVYTNILGSHTVMRAAIKVGTERFVQISSDKAVRPTNVMGASKRAAEILLQAEASGQTRCMAVRFGNVVGSSGSVVPLFQEQIRKGGPVTVTDPDMTRYFMTIPEACQLVLQAGTLGEGGEIFVLEMGTPVKIDTMARDLIRLSGKEPDRDIAIIYTGLRPGEKLYEELITHGEGIVPTAHEKILVLRRNAPPLPGTNREDWLQSLVQCADHQDGESIKQILQQWISEYRPSHIPSVLAGMA